MKIAYAGFDLFYPLLECLADNDCEIVSIFSCKVDNVTETNSAVTRFAQSHNIPITYDRITLDDLKMLKDNGVDALFCAAYYYLMPILPDFRMINLHPSLLPVGRGSWPMPIAILNEYKESGLTFHKMAQDFDTGDILMQKSFELSADETLDTFMQKAYDMLPDMTAQLLSDLNFYYDSATPQGHGKYQSAPDENDYPITPDTDFKTADRILRAFMGFYTIYTDGKNRYRLMRGRAVAGDTKDHRFKIKGGYIECESYDIL